MPRWTALLCVLASTLSAQASPFPGGILDSTGRTAYVASGSGIEGIDLTTGDRVWQTDQAHVPLFFAGGRLHARALIQANSFRIRAFDMGQKGRQVFQSDLITLPRWVEQSTRSGHTFALTWTRKGEQVDLTWHASAAPAGSPPKKASGAVRVDLTTAKIQPLAVPATAKEAALPSQLEKLSIRWWRREAGRLRALVLDEKGKTARLILRSWDDKSGKETSAKELWTGSQPSIMVGHDGKTLWIRETTPSPDALKAQPRWNLYNLADERPLGKVRHVPGTQGGIVIDGKVYVLASSLKPSLDGQTRHRHKLTALDVRTNKVLWSRTLGK